MIDFPPQELTEDAVFEDSTEKNLVNGQSAIWRSENPEDSHEPFCLKDCLEDCHEPLFREDSLHIWGGFH